MKRLSTVLVIMCLTIGVAGAKDAQSPKAPQRAKTTQSTKTPQRVAVDVKVARGMELSNELGVPAVVVEPIINYMSELYATDSAFFCLSSGVVRKFDKTGNYLGVVWPKDGDEAEYLNKAKVGATWIEGDELFMKDGNNSLIIKCNVHNGETITVPIATGFEAKSFQYLIPRRGGGYVGEMIYRGGGPEVIPYALALYDGEFNFVQLVGDMTLNSGLGFGHTLSQYKDETLYWRMLRNTIYSIDNEGGVRPKYEIDFVGHNAPVLKSGEDEYDYLQMLQGLKQDAYASLLSNVMETDDALLFTYVYDDAKYLARYDKRKKTTEAITFNTSSPEDKPMMFINSPGELLIFVTGTDFGLIYKIDLAKIFSSR